MLGAEIPDRDGIEGPPQIAAGLGLLDISTALTGRKTLRQVRGTAYGRPFEGYEMHMGVSGGAGLARPFLLFDDGRSDGAMSADGRAGGCYVHRPLCPGALRPARLGAFLLQASRPAAYLPPFHQHL